MNTNPGELLYLSRSVVESLGIGMSSIIAAVAEGLRAKSAGEVEMPPKPGIHTRPDAFIHAMPAYVKSQEAAGLKWIAGYPGNMARGLPYISGLFLLNDADTGFPLAVMDATWMTAMRTGAASAVAARHLARADSNVLAVLACGVQGRSNLQALVEVLPALHLVQAFDIRREAAETFRDECVSRYGLRCELKTTPREAVAGADVVVTAGPILHDPSPVIVPEWLKPGAFLCTLDFDSYAAPAAFQAADVFSTDDAAQYRYYQQAGYFRGISRDPADLGDIVAGCTPGRTGAAQLTLAANLGLAVEDVVTAKLIYDQACRQGAGVRLSL